MRYKAIPRLDYHHVQPRAIRPPHHHSGDLNDRRDRPGTSGENNRR